MAILRDCGKKKLTTANKRGISVDNSYKALIIKKGEFGR